MKKLLSLLSVLTISGTAVPTTIAASSYQKKENNLENLIIRNKRQNNENKITGITKIVITTNEFVKSSGVVLNDKVYFGSADNKVYEYDPATGQQKIVITTNAIVSSSGVVLNNKLYFGSRNHKVYEYDPATNQQRIVINTNGMILSSGVVLNDKVYFGSADNKVYEYDPATGQQKIVINTNGDVDSSGVVLNNKLYIGSDDGKVYEYDPFELIESDIIDMKEQIKRGLYLNYKKQNPNSEIKNILNINLENLTVSDVTIKQTQKNKALNLEQDLNICEKVNATLINNDNIEQTANTASCSEQLIKTNTFQKMNGFSKSKTEANVDNWSANVNTKVTTKSTVKTGIPFFVKGHVEVGVEVGGGYTWGGSKTYTIGDTSNSSDTEIKTTTKSMIITIPTQSIKIKPHSKISVSVMVWKSNIILILNYYQKVQGIVSADFIDQNNNKTTISISIKESMLSLQENNILPSKIKINNDDSINFSYDIKSNEEIIMQQIEIGKSIPLSLDEQNITFKNNRTGIAVIKN